MRAVAQSLFLCALVSACAGEPFVEHQSRVEGEAALSYVQKEKPAIGRTGRGQVCFAASTPQAEIEQTANDACAEYGLRAVMDGVKRYQCRMTNPHEAYFHCVDPNMKTESGQYVDVFDPKAVAAWESRTGKKAPLRQTAGAYMEWPERGGAAVFSDRPVSQPLLNAAPIPSAAPTLPATPAVAPPPAIIQAPSPAIQPAPPVPMMSPQQPSSPQINSFSLPVGSWGDHF